MTTAKKNIVVLGGGNGASLMLRALKPFADQCSITGIIAMSDSGGSSGFLRKKFGVLPPGDLLRAFIALSRYDSDALREIFYAKRFPVLTNFTDQSKNAPNLGNLLLTILQQDSGIIPALSVFEEALQTVGRVLPITIKHTHLCAELSDGSIIKEEGALDKPTFDRSLSVKRLWLDPPEPAYDKALQALRQADIILISPGDVYTSIIATLLPGGVREALLETKARIIQVMARAKHRDGEPSPDTLSGMVTEIEAYLPRPVDLLVYNDAPVTPEKQATYERESWLPIELDIHNLATKSQGVDFENATGGYSWEKMSLIIGDLLEIRH